MRKKAKKLLRKVVQELSDCKRLFSNQPKKDFTRNRKLPFEQIIKAILCMGGGSVANEMMDLFGFHEDLATTSAFVQQRAKILPEAFESLFDLFVRNITENTFETVVTNLDADDFPPGELKKLYAMRWGIETSFRELKYTVGLQHFHAKKVEFVHQEIFARLTMYNEEEIRALEQLLRQALSRKRKLMEEINSLDPDDRHYTARKADLDERLYKMYDKIEDAENKLLSARAKKATVEAEGITADNIYRILLQFDKLYDHMNEEERRALAKGLISEIQLWPERQPNGQWLKSIRFRLPILPEPMETGLEQTSQTETVVLLSRK